mmetsp:Transcript_7878/g.19555  ORF Transcript_7878/g.19555 Transcript_7878/m.19555 type:complete len:248 (-) Transcript_7878:1031-1774(-)
MVLGTTTGIGCASASGASTTPQGTAMPRSRDKREITSLCIAEIDKQETERLPVVVISGSSPVCCCCSRSNPMTPSNTRRISPSRPRIATGLGPSSTVDSGSRSTTRCCESAPRKLFRISAGDSMDPYEKASSSDDDDDGDTMREGLAAAISARAFFLSLFFCFISWSSDVARSCSACRTLIASSRRLATASSEGGVPSESDDDVGEGLGEGNLKGLPSGFSVFSVGSSSRTSSSWSGSSLCWNPSFV